MTVALTAVSLVPPFMVDANLATVGALVLIHVVAAATFIPVLARKAGPDGISKRGAFT